MEQLNKVIQMVQEAVTILSNQNEQLVNREQKILQTESSLKVRAEELDKKETELNLLAKDIKRNGDLIVSENSVAQRLEAVKIAENELKVRQNEFAKVVAEKESAIKNKEIENENQQKALLEERKELEKQKKELKIREKVLTETEKESK